MLVYKIDVIQELDNIGINTTIVKQNKLFSQSTMKKFKEKDTTISSDNLNRLCCVLEMQPKDIIKFIETDEDRKNIISKISDK